MLTKSVRLVRAIQVIGAVLFLLSFLLPAVRIYPKGQEDLFGYKCAELSARFLYQALRVLFPHHGAGFIDAGTKLWTLGLLCGMSVFINPLIIWYLLATPKWRRRVAILICTFVIETWVALALGGILPLMGNFLWVAGALLLLAPELGTWQRQHLETK